MKTLIAFALMFFATPALAHGQGDHSFAGTLTHYLTTFDHAGLFWGGLALVVVAAVAVHRLVRKGERE